MGVRDTTGCLAATETLDRARRGAGDAEGADAADGRSISIRLGRNPRQSPGMALTTGPLGLPATTGRPAIIPIRPSLPSHRACWSRHAVPTKPH